MKMNTFKTEGELFAALETHIRDENPPLDDLIVMVVRDESGFHASMFWRAELEQSDVSTSSLQTREAIRATVAALQTAPPGRLPVSITYPMEPHRSYLRWLPLETPWEDTN